MGKAPKGNGYYIYRAYITLRNGKRLYAWQKGLKAFPIWISTEKKPKKDGRLS